MLPGQTSLESILDVTRNLCLKFHQNRVSNSWDIADIEFVRWWVVVGVVGGYAKSFSCLTQLKVMLGWVDLWFGWGFDNKRFRTECAQFSSLTLSVSTLNLQSFLVSTSTNTKKNSIPSNQEKWSLEGQFSLDYNEVTTQLFWGCFCFSCCC